MRRWLVFGCGAIGLGAAAWYFGKPASPPAPPPPQPVVVVARAEAPKDAPAKVIEVIDLARAYEPVPEPDDATPGGVDPATFIPVADAPARIPYAVSDEPHWFGDLLRVVRRSPLGEIFFGRGVIPERTYVMPREVEASTGIGAVGCWGFGSGQVRDLLLFEGPVAPVRLDVTPREVK